VTDTAASGTRILIITRNLPPLVGGMERLLYNAVNELSVSYDVAVIGPRGCEQAFPNLHAIKGISPYPLWRFLLSSFFQAVRLGRRFRPHIVFAGSGLTAPFAFLVSRLIGATAVTQLHGLDLVARNLLYRAFFVSMLRRLDAVIVNSHNTARLAAAKRIPADRIHVVHPGITLPTPSTSSSIREFISDNGLAGRKVLLSVGRLTTRKGLSRFIERCMPDIVRDHPNTTLLIAGDAPRNALMTDDSEIVRIRRAIAATGLQEQVHLLGAVPDKVLDLCYQSSDMFVFPAVPVPGDVEGFGIVAVEAAAHGVPTVAFAVGGIPDAVEDGVSGYLVQSQAYPEFTKQVIALLNNPDAISSQDCTRHARQYSVSAFGRQLRSAFELILEPFHRSDTR